MTTYQIIPTTIGHVQELARTMSQDCLNEVWASAHFDAEGALVNSIRYTDYTFTGLADDRVLCIFGVGKPTLLSPVGYPWLLSSYLAKEHTRGLARGSRAAFKHMTQTSGVKHLTNFVDARYTVAVRWLHWMGFTVHSAQPFGIEQRPFHRFNWDLENV